MIQFLKGRRRRLVLLNIQREDYKGQNTFLGGKSPFFCPPKKFAEKFFRV